jgi:hypothetical protein
MVNNQYALILLQATLPALLSDLPGIRLPVFLPIDCA